MVGLRTGSTSYPGAAVLGVEAAWRAGAGMVRYLGPERATSLVLARRPETVTVEGRVQAWVVGSGTDSHERTDAETSALRELLAGSIPVVVDAGALELAVGAAAPIIVSPHGREHDRLRAALELEAVPGDADDAEREASALQSAAALGATVLLKGAVTIVAAPDGWSTRVENGTPWLSTAGTGDVLAGALGAVLAAQGAAGSALRGGHRLAEVAATAAWLHGRAGTAAASAAGLSEYQAGPITALDVAVHLPIAVAEALAAR
ncbi:NAD(P)H-hydrate dehydratase [Microbacterium rhizomatis]|uniref:NAD(P)H-hydrate dehydratase n=1 Tax=Microbacterium rhizomatis TaxID=1631477 RepID=A0A5J5J941_9MICO|nr:NAD(P)H-hydrate dehydratase [Microbacterium rhizomatis]